MIICRDGNSRTCLEVARSGGAVRYILMDNSGLTVTSMGAMDFDARFTPIKYDRVKAAKKYLECATMFGANEKVLTELGKVVEVSDQARMAALSKNGQVEVATDGTVTQKPKGFQKKKGGAANRFRDLIMGGAHTDDEIFSIVQKEFNLDEGRRSFVGWHRKDLTKKGFNPPPPKEK